MYTSCKPLTVCGVVDAARSYLSNATTRFEVKYEQ
jgi:hypothetical protein